MTEPMSLAEVEPQRRADCAIGEISQAQREWNKRNRRPSTLSSREALMVLEFEATFVAVCASNLAKGIVLNGSDHQRLWLAQSRISTIVDEVARR